MEARKIRYFLTTCETLNFSRAAEQCEVSVPTLTKAIHKLEKDLGGQLFRRERQMTHLTDLGRLMQQHFSVAQEALDAARNDAERYRSLSDVKLKMGIFSSMGAKQLTAYLRTLRAAAPNLELVLWESHCEELHEALLAGEIDVAIVSTTDNGERLRATPLYKEPFYIAFGAGHRFEKMKTVPLKELIGEPYVKRLHCEFPANLVKLGGSISYSDLRVRYVTEREDWVQTMVAAGLGCTVMPRFLPMVDGVLTRPLTDPEVSRQISMVTVMGRPHSQPVAIAIKSAQSIDWHDGFR